MFEKTLTDIVKGIRASKRDTSLYISQCIAECKEEVSSRDMYVKGNALQKLVFLHMLGYNMSWANFAAIELMSSPRFAHKRIAYLAASQGFTKDTEVVLLTTNLLKKELRGGVYEAGLAINCISNIVTEDVASDLLPELTSLTSHGNPYLRKKAILCLFKVFMKYPQGLRLTFANIQQCLDDPNPSVVSCAVNVVTELSDKNPKNYLHLAPAFFQLLTTSSNNWMLIKVVKLLSSLVPEEPRLARKLLEPLADIVRTTRAKSLMYESVYAITICLPYCRKSDGTMPPIVPDIVTLCAETLQGFVNEADQNLKYLGLVGFASLMQSHPRVLSAPGYRPIILACLSDQDVTIRSRSLGLLTGMASRKNLIELVSQLLEHVELATGSYKLDLVSKIVEMCSGEKYALLTDFVWYSEVLFQLGHMRGLELLSEMLRAQIIDIALRVLPVRGHAVRRSIEILLEREGPPSSDPYGDNGRGKNLMPEILPAIAWIIGEYSDLVRASLSLDGNNGEDLYLDDKSEGTYHSVIQVVMSTSNCHKLPESTQKVFIQAALKVFAAATADKTVSDAELEASLDIIKCSLPVYMQSTDVEVKERSFTGHKLLVSFGLLAAIDIAPHLRNLVDEDMDDNDADEAPAVDRSNIKAGDSDFLGMTTGSATADLPITRRVDISHSHSSLASKCRDASTTLNFLLKPSPMKPTSAKAQRKKSQSLVLLKSIDLSAFATLIDAENVGLGSRYSMEFVSFTQQSVLRPQEKMSAGASLPVDSQAAAPLTDSTLSSFQRTDMMESTESSGCNSRQNRSGDPFYLDSAPSNEGENSKDPSRFGMIQLSDSDDEPAVSTTKKKRRKKEKKKKHKQGENIHAHPGHPVAVYESDEDDKLPLSGVRKKGPGKEFEDLAKVDLTAPLREDEVMPERKHRVVTSVPAQHLPPEEEVFQNKEKKRKKAKNRKTKSSAYDVGDLLELGGFSTAAAPVNAKEASGGAAVLLSQTVKPPLGGANVISDVFEDLLGLREPAVQLPPAPALDARSFHPPPGQFSLKSGKGPWMKAHVKFSSARASALVDWSRVALQSRVYRTNYPQATAAMLVFRIQNTSAASMNGLRLSLHDHQTIVIGDVGPGSSAETCKVGPFLYTETDAGVDIRGTLFCADSKVSVKVRLPACLQLTPAECLNLLDVSKELALPTGSHSTKIDLSPGTPVESVLPMLCGFLRSAVVDSRGAGGSSTVGTLAAQSNAGVKIFFMVKVKESTVKIDVKCSDNQMLENVCADLKKLVF